MLDGGALQLDMKGQEGDTMRISITFGAAILALVAVVTSCTTLGGETAGSGNVYLVGVAGGG